MFYFILLFPLVFAVFKLAGWPTRANIARGSQWVPKDLTAISLFHGPKTGRAGGALRALRPRRRARGRADQGGPAGLGLPGRARDGEREPLGHLRAGHDPRARRRAPSPNHTV